MLLAVALPGPLSLAANLGFDLTEMPQDLSNVPSPFKSESHS